MPNINKTIAVITSTIGRPELEKAIISVQNQIYPCQHYVFVDGEAYFEKVKPLAQKYPDVIFTYLPMNTGKNGWTNSYINAIAPFLVKEDILCYLDDDNWYDNQHTQTIAKAFQHSNLGFAFTSRRFIDQETGEFLCNDNRESIGFWAFKDATFTYSAEYNGKSVTLKDTLGDGFHIDTNCLALSRDVARYFAPDWAIKQQNDRYIANQLIQSQVSGICTGEITVNYAFDFNKQTNVTSPVFELFEIDPQDSVNVKKLKRSLMLQANQFAGEAFEFKWLKPWLLENGALVQLNDDFTPITSG